MATGGLALITSWQGLAALEAAMHLKTPAVVGFWLAHWEEMRWQGPAMVGSATSRTRRLSRPMVASPNVAEMLAFLGYLETFQN